MKKRETFLRRIGILLIAVWIGLLTGGCALFEEQPYPSATDQFFVNDFADVLSDEDEQRIYNSGVRLFDATGAQVVLATVDSLGGRELEDYSIGLAREWGIGDAEKDNGILLLFLTDGPHSRIEVGSGLEGALPDSKAGRILDTYLVPWYEDSDGWSEALFNTYMALTNVVYTEYGMTEELYDLPEKKTDPVMDTVEWIVTLLPLIIFILIILLNRRGHHIWIFPGGFGGGGGFRGGGFGGGGGGFSGGGGGFSGGGGGFSGGGASR